MSTYSIYICMHEPIASQVAPFLQPIPAGSHIICTASLDSIEGRKTWVRATVKDKPDGVEYAAGKALFVIPKKHPLDRPSDGVKEQERARAAGRLPEIHIHSCTCCHAIVFDPQRRMFAFTALIASYTTISIPWTAAHHWWRMTQDCMAAGLTVHSAEALGTTSQRLFLLLIFQLVSSELRCNACRHVLCQNVQSFLALCSRCPIL